MSSSSTDLFISDAPKLFLVAQLSGFDDKEKYRWRWFLSLSLSLPLSLSLSLSFSLSLSLRKLQRNMLELKKATLVLVGLVKLSEVRKPVKLGGQFGIVEKLAVLLLASS